MTTMRTLLFATAVLCLATPALAGDHYRWWTDQSVGASWAWACGAFSIGTGATRNFIRAPIAAAASCDERKIYSTLLPGGESSNTVCTGGVPEKPSSFQRATTCS